MGDDGFTFPTLPAPPKLPLTAQSTVVHASAAGAAASITSKPTQVAAEGRRNKVPLEKGFSQVDWLRVARSGADLTGGQGCRRDITLEEVWQHQKPDDAWMVLHGKVYNITPYLRFHPGGADILVKSAGRDGTALFNKYHPWVNAHALLEKCLLGLLQQQVPPQQQRQQH
ncbi:flavohemo protein b5/b5R-like protein [Scenedesmus sp. NREL 46B-D3]|nr:flavohemo protein b5/b5R-like protein [Scenedesmus sp. NREL 46B-D3]